MVYYQPYFESFVFIFIFIFYSFLQKKSSEKMVYLIMVLNSSLIWARRSIQSQKISVQVEAIIIKRILCCKFQQFDHRMGKEN